MSPEGELFVSAPTLGSYDHVYRIDRDGEVAHARRRRSAGRRGWRSRPTASLHVVDALAGASGLYRFADLDGAPELVVAGGALVGVAFGPGGELVVTSNDTAYRFDDLTTTTVRHRLS